MELMVIECLRREGVVRLAVFAQAGRRKEGSRPKDRFAKSGLACSVVACEVACTRRTG